MLNKKNFEFFFNCPRWFISLCFELSSWKFNLKFKNGIQEKCLDKALYTEIRAGKTIICQGDNKLATVVWKAPIITTRFLFSIWWALSFTNSKYNFIKIVFPEICVIILKKAFKYISYSKVLPSILPWGEFQV